jgi:hypothetical protein
MPCEPAVYAIDPEYGDLGTGYISEEDWSCVASALADGANVRVGLSAQMSAAFVFESFTTTLSRIQPDLVVVEAGYWYFDDVGNDWSWTDLRPVSLEEGQISTCLELGTASEQFLCIHAIGWADAACPDPEILVCAG